MNIIRPAQTTKLGKLYHTSIERFMRSPQGKNLRGKVQLLFTSPPFPLNNKKRYGNLNGDAYMEWLSKLAPYFAELLKPDGSMVIEIGNAWESGRPVQSLLHLQSLISFVSNPKANLRLCQEFICYNPSRLPSPAQWVTVHRVRTVDSFTRLWWMAKTDFPKADNRKILRPYSDAMKSLLKRKTFNRKPRPSDHTINETAFLRNNGGSIAPNVIELEQIDPNREQRLPKNVLSFANTSSNATFLAKCREKKIIPHPARMPEQLAAFFIEFLTKKGDIVFDPFSGSNTTGFVAEKLGRDWVGVEPVKDYVMQSKLRFTADKEKKRKAANS